jgi:hypothetical protein
MLVYDFTLAGLAITIFLKILVECSGELMCVISLKKMGWTHISQGIQELEHVYVISESYVARLTQLLCHAK